MTVSSNKKKEQARSELIASLPLLLRILIRCAACCWLLSWLLVGMAYGSFPSLLSARVFELYLALASSHAWLSDTTLLATTVEETNSQLWSDGNFLGHVAWISSIEQHYKQFKYLLLVGNTEMRWYIKWQSKQEEESSVSFNPAALYC